MNNFHYIIWVVVYFVFVQYKVLKQTTDYSKHLNAQLSFKSISTGKLSYRTGFAVFNKLVKKKPNSFSLLWELPK